MRQYLVTAALVLTAGVAPAQDSISHRVILIGDAGRVNDKQQAIIKDAASHIITDKTTVLYLGDNIFNDGMALTAGEEQERNQQILRSQYQPMRNGGATVYFIPGNYDWDKSGKNGLAKVKKQWEYLNTQKDPKLQMVPFNGCPDPIEINVDENLTIIAFDSEWWLFPFNKTNAIADCDCATKDEVITRLAELYYKNRYKVIILASHHPFQSYGVHGGYFTWKDHLFPFTAANKNLYIPLPIVGSLYPLLRKSFTNAEDLRHPLYKEMIRRVDKVFDSFPNLVHVAGHEQGLQLIKGKQLQVVSGSGSTASSAIKKGNSLFADDVQGYVTVDLLINHETRFTYYTYKDGATQQAFSYSQPYKDVKAQDELFYTAINTDSIAVSAYAPYNDVGNLHRKLFGENYRKEWAAKATLPVIKISEVKGGLTPLKRGGGHQTLSLRLKDNEGKEWVLRTIEKYPEALLPESLRGTFVKDIINDAMTSQNPYSPLVVPVLANAVKVEHANPVIGYVAPDKQLGGYEKIFVNRVCLYEEREPTGNSDNTAKMLKELNDDNDNSIDTGSFFRARMLDLYLGDWDRHEDQWRWFDAKKGSSKKYIAVPRDRDQALYRSYGFFPWLSTQAAVAPFLRGFRPDIKLVNEFFINGKNLDNRFLNQMDHDQWMKTMKEFTTSLTDSVLDESLKKLPKGVYEIRHEQLFDIMKKRRDKLPAASEKYFYFLNKIADVRVSDKSELVELLDAPNNGILLVIHKLSKDRNVREQLFSKVYLPSVTKEIRLFIGQGDDSVVVNTTQSSIKVRIVGGDGNKQYNVVHAAKKMHVYEMDNNASFTGMTHKLRKHLSDDSTNIAIVPSNRYNSTLPLLTAGLNPDDGFLIGFSLKHTRQGFRKTPFASTHQLAMAYAFATNAYRVAYRGEWIGRAGRPDFILQGIAKAPTNTQNFFGRGNETPFVKEGDYKKFYRTRFNIFQAETGLRWRGSKGSSFTIGPSYQFYHYDPDENKGRFITNESLIGSYDSSTIENDKTHLGLFIHYNTDRRNNKILTTWGYYINVRAHGYLGMNNYSKSFVQIIPEIAIYKSLNATQTIVLAERLGGGISLGKTTFYQSLFIGGHENLMGYRQYRFAGQYSMYNNLELRIKLSDFASYVLPGQFGLTLLYDVGRVWENNDDSNKWHNGIGGGFYFAPAQLVVLQVVASYSVEGLYPTFSMGFRF